MAWSGYYEYDSTEIINVERIEKYVSDNAPLWFKESYNTDALSQVFNTTYDSPVADNAPWTDPDRADSYDFWGVYPLSIEGLEDSTRQSTVTEYIRNGGNPGRLRHATKSVVFSAALLGASECAVEYGFNWLKSALLGRACEPGGDSRCYGADLTYFSCEPVIDEATVACETVTVTLAEDSFDRANNANTLGTPDNGPEYEVHNGVWGILTNEAHATAGPTSTYSTAVMDVGEADCTFEVTLPTWPSANVAGVVVRSVSPGMGLFFGDSSVVKIAPSGQTQGPTYSQTFLGGDRMRVQMSGPNVLVFRQIAAAGAWLQVLTYTDEETQEATRHGMWEFSPAGTTARFNNLLMTQVVCAPGPVEAVLDGGFDQDRTQVQFSDDFARPDATTLGDPWVYSQFGGGTTGFSIEDEEAKVTTPTLGSNYTFATVDAATADVIFECLIPDVSLDLFSGVVFRRDPNDSTSGFIADRDDIYVGPAFTPGILDFSSTFQSGDRMRIFLVGSNIRVDRQTGGVGDWATVGTVTNASYSTNTHFGLAGWSDESSAARWDDFRIMYGDPTYPTVDGGTPSTVFTSTFDGGAPGTVFPILLTAPLPEPFVAEPEPPNSDPTGCIADLQRNLKNVQVNSGPSITAKKYLSDGSCMWTVQWTAVAGDPFEYGHERVVVDGFLSGEGGDPFGEGVDGPFDEVGYPHTDVACPPAVWEALYDPLCPALVAPPGPVDIPAGCFEATNEWWRRFLSIPEDFVPLWGSSVPVIGLTAQFDDLRNVRLRLYADVADSGDPEADQCATVADLLVSYVPQGYTLILDGVRQAVYAVDQDGVQRRADSLVFASDGKPIIWPELTCGYGYLMTVDTMEASDVPAVDLSVVAKVT